MPQSKLIEFADHSNDVGDLLCPRCKGFYLHHTGVTLYERGEDQDSATVIDTNGPTVTVKNTSGAGNPSSRRHGMVIKFDCELCSSGDADDYIHLAFAQHKGSTEVSWQFSAQKPPRED